MPSLTEDNDWYGALVRLAEHCERAAELLERAGDKPKTPREKDAGVDDGRQTVPQNDHDYCPVALQLKEIGVALGMRSKAKSEEIRVLLKSTGIVIKTLSRKQHLVALDTLSSTYRDRFATYVKNTYGQDIHPDSP